MDGFSLSFEADTDAQEEAEQQEAGRLKADESLECVKPRPHRLS